MPNLATAPPRAPSPLRDTLRQHLHEALDELIDAGESLTGEEATAVDNAFVTLLRLARANAYKPGKVRS